MWRGNLAALGSSGVEQPVGLIGRGSSSWQVVSDLAMIYHPAAEAATVVIAL